MSYTESKSRSQKKIHDKAKIAYNEFIKIYPFAANLDEVDEKWRDIADYDGYQISNYGRVKNIKFNIPRIMTPSLDSWGYLRVALRQKGKNKSQFIHGLVARAFVPNPDNKPFVHHIDGNKFNCHESNLMWVTRSENMKYNFQLGLSAQPMGEESCRSILKNNQAEAVLILQATGRYSYQEIGDILGVTSHVVGEIVRGETYRNCRAGIEGIVECFERGKDYMKDHLMQVFDNKDFGKIRGVMIDGEPYFVGKDVAVALGYVNTKDALARHVDVDDKREGVAFHDPFHVVFPVLINESGLYSLILSSKLPKAKAFKRWITSEVLPSIRKTGKYEVNRATEVEKLSLEKRIEYLLEAVKISPTDEIKIELLRKVASLIYSSGCTSSI